MPAFKPEGGEPLVVRSTLGAVPENNTRSHMLPMTQKDFAGTRPDTSSRARFGQLTQSSFFGRHNPQPGRVRHIKGLLDLPICAVRDDGFMRNPLLHLRDQPPRSADLRRSLPARLPIQSINYHPKHSNPALQAHRVNQIDASKYFQRFPFSLKERADPRLGLVTHTDAWRDELITLVDKAGLGLPKEVKEHQREQPKRTSVYSPDTGRLIPPPSRAMSRGASPQKQRETFLHIAPEQSNEALVLEMLCQILQTDSIGAVQEWLVASGEKEKDLALNIIKVAIGAEDGYWDQTAEKGIPSFDTFYTNTRPMSQPPSNMILENGYGAVDVPSPRPRAGTSMSRLGTGYSRYSYEGGDHKRASSHTPDILRVDHYSPRPTSRPQRRALSRSQSNLEKRSPVPGSWRHSPFPTSRVETMSKGLFRS